MANDVRGEPDLSPQEERWLGRMGAGRVRQRLSLCDRLSDEQAAVLHPPRPARPGYSNSFDLLFRGTELVTGGQRLHRYADYLAALAARRV